MSDDSELGPDGRWLLHQVLLTEIGHLETQELVQQAREGIGRILGVELTDEYFWSLLDAKRKHVGVPGVGESEAGWPTPIALALAGMVEVPIGRWDRLVFHLVDAFEVLVRYLAAIASQGEFGQSVKLDYLGTRVDAGHPASTGADPTAFKMRHWRVLSEQNPIQVGVHL
jgi:hypothetical protein